jgi:hypothetical protein
MSDFSTARMSIIYVIANMPHNFRAGGCRVKSKEFYNLFFVKIQTF